MGRFARSKKVRAYVPPANISAANLIGSWASSSPNRKERRALDRATKGKGGK